LPIATFEICSWASTDGLRLAYRAYPGDATRLPVICLPGLTQWPRFRGSGPAYRRQRPPRAVPRSARAGESDYARDPMTYQPPVYAQDLAGLLAAEITRFIAVGTSLGGILTMALAPGSRAGGGRGAQRYRPGDRSGRPGAHHRLCRPGAQLSHLDARRAACARRWAISIRISHRDWLRLAKRLMALGTGGRIALTMT
jgi:hypothetical protein